MAKGGELLVSLGRMRLLAEKVQGQLVNTNSVYYPQTTRKSCLFSAYTFDE